MVDYNTWLSIGLEQCTNNAMSNERRKAVFSELAQGWNEQKEEIEAMTEAEVREELVCP